MKAVAAVRPRPLDRLLKVHFGRPTRHGCAMEQLPVRAGRPLQHGSSAPASIIQGGAGAPAAKRAGHGMACSAWTPRRAGH